MVSANARLVASDEYRAFDVVVPANACPEIAISITIDAANARFFVMALFPCVSESPIAGKCTSPGIQDAGLCKD